MTSASDLTRRLKAFVKEQGGDLVGVTPVERLKGAPKGYRPQDIWPKAKYVIVMGKRIIRGTAETAPSFLYGAEYYRVNYMLEYLAHSVCCFLEDEGFDACQIPATGYGYKTGGFVELRGPISLRHAAVAAGLGGWGFNGVVLTPEFGPRIRFIAVLTNAPLEPDPPFEKEICTRCMACVKNCPVQAISEDGTLNRHLCSANIMDTERKTGYLTCGVCVRVCPVGMRSPRK